jgi:hypothetical protein
MLGWLTTIWGVIRYVLGRQGPTIIIHLPPPTLPERAPVGSTGPPPSESKPCPEAQPTGSPQVFLPPRPCPRPPLEEEDFMSDAYEARFIRDLQGSCDPGDQLTFEDMEPPGQGETRP